MIHVHDSLHLSSELWWCLFRQRTLGRNSNVSAMALYSALLASVDNDQSVYVQCPEGVNNAVEGKRAKGPLGPRGRWATQRGQGREQ